MEKICKEKTCFQAFILFFRSFRFFTCVRSLIRCGQINHSSSRSILKGIISPWKGWRFEKVSLDIKEQNERMRSFEYKHIYIYNVVEYLWNKTLKEKKLFSTIWKCPWGTLPALLELFLYACVASLHCRSSRHSWNARWERLHLRHHWFGSDDRERRGSLDSTLKPSHDSHPWSLYPLRFSPLFLSFLRRLSSRDLDIFPRCSPIFETNRAFLLASQK